MYKKALEYLQNNDRGSSNISQLDLKPSQDRQFSLLSLPASPSPEALYNFYKNKQSHNEEMVSSYIHDLILYDVQDNLDRNIFFQQLKDKFTSHPFVQAIVYLIKMEKSARFGLVNKWIQDNCSDKPTPSEEEHLLQFDKQDKTIMFVGGFVDACIPR